MQAFSWELAESLAAAHMRALGFHDARTTSPGADKGIDVLSSRAAAQVKALQTPVGAPDVQKLKGSAHLFENQLFYSMSGYTDQAIKFADAANVSLFVFDQQNNVEPINGSAIAMSETLDQDPEFVEARSAIKQLTDQVASVQALLRYLTDWMAETPWGLNAPAEMAARLVMPTMAVTLSTMALPNVNDLKDTIKWSEKTSAAVRDAKAQLGQVIGLDFAGIDAAEAIEKLELVRNGDLSEIQMPEHLWPILDRHPTREEGWLYLSEFLLEVRAIQKFLKLLYQIKNELIAEGKDWAENTKVEKVWDLAMSQAQEINRWANRVMTEDIRPVDELRQLFVELRETLGPVCEFHGLNAESIYEESRFKPNSWLNDSDEDQDD